MIHNVGANIHKIDAQGKEMINNYLVVLSLK